MAKLILAVNAGSSSVKVSLFTVDRTAAGQPTIQQALAEIQVSGLTNPPARLTYRRRSQQVEHDQALPDIHDQDAALEYILDHLVKDAELDELKARSDISLACHRVVHGGDCDKPLRITHETLHHIEELTDLAPLHNASALDIIKSCIKKLPDAHNVAVFDSQFHQTMPQHIRTYPIDQDIAQRNKLRKYGFHGISYSFITRSVSKYLKKPVNETNLIVLHLGSGASACAIKNGASYDTSMGLTPLAGLPGATRSGSVDPSLVFHYAANVGKLSGSSTDSVHISRAEDILNKQAGWQSLTGTTDFGTIASSSRPEMRLAFDILVDRICGFVGAYYVSLGGKIDALVFAGGIGEKSERLRAAVSDAVSCLGFKLDAVANSSLPDKDGSAVYDIGAADARHMTLICHTDEQTEMAHLCALEHLD